MESSKNSPATTPSPSGYGRAIRAAIRSSRRIWRPAPKIRVSDWAEQNVRIPSEYGIEPGRWRNDRYPYQRAMMDVVHEPGVWRVVLRTSSQVGKSSVIDNVFGYFVDQDPSPVLWVFPTLEVAEGYSRDRLSSLVRETPALSGRIADVKSRDSGNTLLHKQFPGGHLTIAGANSPASLSSRPIRIILGDEIDRWPPSAGTEGDPVSLAVKRTTRFWNRLVFLASTPTNKGASRIEKAWNESDQRYFYVPCHGCGEYQVLDWENVRWENHDPETAVLVCAFCKRAIRDEERLEMIGRGEWRATAELNGTAGFHVWEAYAVNRLAAIVEEFLEKKKDRESLKTFVNLVLGEEWEEESEAPEWVEIKARAEDYALMSVPSGALLLTAGVDVQDDRLAVLVVGWGRGEEAWVIYWSEIFGDPIQGEVWSELDSLIAHSFESSGGFPLRIHCVAVDSGGHRTQAVYNYCRPRSRGVIAIKGINQPGRPILAGRPTPQDVSWSGRTVQNGVLLWHVGTDTAKADLYARLRLTEPGPRFIHFPAALPDTFYEQLTAERLVTRYHRGVARLEWTKANHARNEALDAFVYAYAAAIRSGLQRCDWDNLERALGRSKRETESSRTRELPMALRSRWMTHGISRLLPPRG